MPEIHFLGYSSWRNQDPLRFWLEWLVLHGNPIARIFRITGASSDLLGYNICMPCFWY
jgi:hypothetical protein